VAFGTDIFYATADGKYLLNGDMRELPTMRNISDEALQRIRKPLIDELAKADSIDFPAKGGSKHTITVFTDIDCGYCRKLHQGMDEMNELGISVHYVAYPRAGIGSPSYDKWVDVWCSDDRQQSMTTAKNGGKLENGECDAPVADHMRLAAKLGVRGTPAVFDEDGRQLGGYLPPKRMLQALEN
jgi:thiol:disulfide interchange protein DsbC